MATKHLGTNPPMVQGTLPTIAHVYQVLGVAMVIPAIAVATSATATASVLGLAVGDVIVASLASGSAAYPASVTPADYSCSTAGTLTVRYANVSGLAASLRTTVTINIVVFSNT